MDYAVENNKKRINKCILPLKIEKLVLDFINLFLLWFEMLIKTS